MTEKPTTSKKAFSTDWLLRGALTKIGDTFDRFTGRRWIPSSSIATSELVERIKKLLDAEAKEVSGKGLVVPHNIKLKMQWDKFSIDAEDAIKRLENELLTATADHINDSLYYTYAPLAIEVKPDYFTEGVKLLVSFDKFDEEENSDVEMNVTIPGIKADGILPKADDKPEISSETYIARFKLKGVRQEKRLEFPARESISVGRTGSNAFVIDDVSVSKMHASLSADPDGNLSVADTGSTNGTFLNDQRISYGKATRLEKDDKVKFGTIEVAFEYVPHELAAVANDVSIDQAETIEIDGFEFTKRVTDDTDGSSKVLIPLAEEPKTEVDE